MQFAACFTSQIFVKCHLSIKFIWWRNLSPISLEEMRLSFLLCFQFIYDTTSRTFEVVHSAVNSYFKSFMWLFWVAWYHAETLQRNTIVMLCGIGLMWSCKKVIWVLQVCAWGYVKYLMRAHPLSFYLLACSSGWFRWIRTILITGTTINFLTSLNWIDVNIKICDGRVTDKTGGIEIWKRNEKSINSLLQLRMKKNSDSNEILTNGWRAKR